MAVLIAVKTPGGREICDARCYHAKHDTCSCVCGGKNHGVGYHQALRNVEAQHAALRQKYGEQGIEFPAHAQGWYLVGALPGDPALVDGPHERKKDAVGHLPFAPWRKARLYPSVYEYAGLVGTPANNATLWVATRT